MPNIPAKVFTSLSIIVLTTMKVPRSFGVELQGYYKNLLLHSETVVGQPKSYWQDINRLRLNVSSDWRHIDMNLIVDNEVQLGSYLDTHQFRWLIEKPNRQYWDLQANTIDRGDIYTEFAVYRGTLQAAWDNVDLRIGRQQINWATAAIWNPMDRFNPLNPLQLERDERDGIDALLVDISVGDLSRLSFAFAPQHASSDSGAARYKSNVGLYDWSVMVGKFEGVPKTGIGLSGQLALVGLRSEIVVSNPAQGSHYVEWVVGADYTFLNGVSLLLEGYVNGNGETNSARYDFNSLVDGKIFGVSRRYLGLQVSKEVSPLLSFAVYGIKNFDDHSLFLYPTVNYILPTFDDVYLEIGAQLTQGDEQDEFGYFNDVVYGQVLFYF